jgi:hypothetical protein
VRGSGGLIGSSFLICSSIFFGNVTHTEIRNQQTHIENLIKPNLSKAMQSGAIPCGRKDMNIIMNYLGINE